MKHLKFATSALALAVLAGCGGGGNTDDPIATNQTSKTIQGVISGFGSVIVNGVHYDVSKANLTADGTPITEADLKVGMVVKIKGKGNSDGTGEALELEFDNDVEGPITRIDLANNQIDVMGKTISIDKSTVFDDVDLDTLTLGTVVEASGHFDASGTILASYIGASDETEYEIKGYITELDTTAKTFKMGNQVVNYEGAVIEDAFTLENDLFVEVETSQALVSGVFMADEIEMEDEGVDVDTEEGSEIEISGMVSSISPTGEFVINGQTIQWKLSTEFEHGSLDHIGSNVFLNVEAEVDSHGDLIAKSIEFKPDDTFEIKTMLDNVDSASGVLTLFGQSFVMNDKTMIRDESSENDHFLNIEKLLSGQWVEVSAYKNEAGSFIVTKIERESAEDSGESEIEGVIQEVTDTGFTIEGFAITTDGNTVFDPTDFTPAMGNTVEVSGSIVSDGVFAATSVSLDD